MVIVTEMLNIQYNFIGEYLDIFGGKKTLIFFKINLCVRVPLEDYVFS